MSSNNLHSTCLDFERQIFAYVGPGAPSTYAPNANQGSQYTDASNGNFYVMVGTTWTLMGASGGISQSYADGKYWYSGSHPTTLAGYGITDALALSGGSMTGSLVANNGFTANTMSLGGQLTALCAPGNESVIFLASGNTNDSQARFRVSYNGLLQWGPGGSTSPTANLSLGSPGVLAVGGGLTISGALSVASTLTSGDVHTYRDATTGYVYFGSNNAAWLGFNGYSFTMNGGLAISSRFEVTQTSTPLDIQIHGSPTNGLQVAMGDASVWGTIGTRYSAGDLYMGYNAYQTTRNTDAWAQNYASLGSVRWLVGAGGAFLSTAPAGQGATVESSFWTTKVTLDTSGNGTFTGVVRSSSTYGWTVGELASYARIRFGAASSTTFDFLTGGGAYAQVLAGSYTASNSYGAVPSNTTFLAIGAGGGSPNAASMSWGDGTGWKFNMGPNISGTFTPRFLFNDVGALTIQNTTANQASLSLIGARNWSFYTDTGGALNFNDNTAGATRWFMAASGHLAPGSNGAYDIGGSGNQVRTLYAGNGIFSSGIDVTGTTTFHSPISQQGYAVPMIIYSSSAPSGTAPSGTIWLQY